MSQFLEMCSVCSPGFRVNECLSFFFIFSTFSLRCQKRQRLGVTPFCNSGLGPVPLCFLLPPPQYEPDGNPKAAQRAVRAHIPTHRSPCGRCVSHEPTSRPLCVAPTRRASWRRWGKPERPWIRGHVEPFPVGIEWGKRHPRKPKRIFVCRPKPELKKHVIRSAQQFGCLQCGRKRERMAQAQAGAKEWGKGVLHGRGGPPEESW